MTPEKVYERFVQEFPGMKGQIVKFFTHRTSDKSSAIRILLKNNRTLIFAVYPDGSYILKR